MEKNEEIEKLQHVLNQTLKLISLYKKSDLTIPFALKGNLGEFIVAIELLKRFPNHKIDYRGGAFPGIDISIDNVKIQVKTRIKRPPEKFKNGEWDYESSPTIKKNTLYKKKCDILILVILYLNEDFSKIKKSNIYIFNQDDFRYFNTKFCWSGKSKGDYTIVNVLYVKGNPPPKLKEKIDFYNKPEYKELFNKAKENWNKIKTLLQLS
ncbi:MAG: hypothetical protein QW051_01350 [Candidatus Aenigmatarchaeota archaeon]